MSSTKSQSDGSCRGLFNTSDHLPACEPYIPYRRWWLHNHEQISFQEQFDGPEAEVTSTANSVDQTKKFNGENQFIEECCRKANPKIDGSACFYQRRKVVDSYGKLEQHSGTQDLNGIIGDDLQKMAENKDFNELSVADTYSMDLDFYSSQVSQHSRKLCSDLDSCWIGFEKSEPWWRTADKGDLASIVTNESLKHTENCDLPWPQNSGRRASTCVPNFDKVIRHTTSDIPTEADSTSRDLTSASMDKTLLTPSVIGCSPLSSDSPSSGDGLSAEKSSFVQTQQVSNPDVSRVQLLEALCHSQTRAREAENLAQQAYDEKEQIIKLYFRQASHLFAYRQWVEILRLEALCLQLRSKGVYISTHFPVLSKGRQLRKGRRWTGKRKPGKPKTKMSNCFVAFAVGLGLVGAGLLLGWTIGWLFPTF